MPYDTPEDYETCGTCGFDHEYEWEESQRAHQALALQEELDGPPTIREIPSIEPVKIRYVLFPPLPPSAFAQKLQYQESVEEVNRAIMQWIYQS